MTTDVDAFAQLLQTGLITALVNILSFVGVLVVLEPDQLAADARRAGARAAARARRPSGSVAARPRPTRTRGRPSPPSTPSSRRASPACARRRRTCRRTAPSIRSRRRRSGYLDARIRTQVLQAIYFPFILFLATCGDAIVLGLGSALVHDGTIAAGTVIAFLLYLDQFFAPVQQLSQVFDQWQQAVASMAKINELMRTEVTTPDAVRPGRAGRAARRRPLPTTCGSRTPRPAARSCTASTCTSRRARPSPSWARPVPASRRW